MDLLATVKKEGSRGGTADFKWSDVQNSSHREHYLGHSLMAPVGRWAKNRDLNWYAKANDADGENAQEQAARERKEEIKRIKEAEEDALARALGLPVPDRTNANLIPVAQRGDESNPTADKQEGSELDKALKEYKRRHGDENSHRRRHRSRSPERKKHHSERRHRHRSSERNRKRSRSRSRERDRHHRPRSRSPHRSRRYDRD